VKLESGAASYKRLAMFSLLFASRFCASFSRFFSSFFSRFDRRRSRSGAGAAFLVESPRPLHYIQRVHNYSVSHCKIKQNKKWNQKVKYKTKHSGKHKRLANQLIVFGQLTDQLLYYVSHCFSLNFQQTVRNISTLDCHINGSYLHFITLSYSNCLFFL